jgi:hypothetical protein
MLNHLLTLEPEPLTEAASSFVEAEKATPSQLLSGKVATDEWLRNLGAESPVPMDPAYEAALAQHAFGVVTHATPVESEEEARKKVLALRTPEAVRKVVGMLTAYEWEFVEHAQQIRSYIVAGLMEETKHTKPEIRLKAYKMLGDVTEVGLFTHRTEVVTRDLSDEQIQAEINRRLEALTINANTPLLERVDSEVDDDAT